MRPWKICLGLLLLILSRRERKKRRRRLKVGSLTLLSNKVTRQGRCIIGEVLARIVKLN